MSFYQVVNGELFKISANSEFENDIKYWITFTTSDYLSLLLEHQNFISGNKMIITQVLSKENIVEIISRLDSTNELIELCTEY